ncbi:MAG: addiction module protein [Melioribacteraceae bacterium]
METKNIIQSALSLSPAERLFIIEALSQSLSEPNSDVEKLWKEEIEQRYNALQCGKIKTIPYEEILKK